MFIWKPKKLNLPLHESCYFRVYCIRANRSPLKGLIIRVTLSRQALFSAKSLISISELVAFFAVCKEIMHRHTCYKSS